MYEVHGIQLDKQQYEAVTAPIDQPALVIAGAGSGKTRVLEARTIYLIDNGINPEEIIATTFTQKAAKELKERITKTLGSRITNKINSGTIHSVCYKFLRDKGLSSIIADELHKKMFIEEGLKNIKSDLGWQYPLYWINRCKADLISPEESNAFIYNKLVTCSGTDENTGSKLARQLSSTYGYYELKKIEADMIDFADMIYLMARKLQTDNEWKLQLQSKVSYVLIDEAQDNMKLAVTILETLSAPENRIYMCCDDMQEIYGWNLADVDNNVFGFMQRYKDANMYKIETNYRSSKKIVTLSNKLINHHYSEERMKFKKTLAPSITANDGCDVTVLACEDQTDEADVVGNWIQGLIENGKKPEDIYVLYRLNALSRPIEDKLTKLEIPYEVLGGVNFYDRPVIKDMLSYFLLIQDKGPDSNNAFKRIANIATVAFSKYYRGIGSVFYTECLTYDESIWQGMLKLKNSESCNYYKKQCINDVVAMFKVLEKEGDGNPNKIVKLIRKIAYDNWLNKKEGMSNSGDNELFDDLNELETVTSGFETIEDFLQYVIKVKRAIEFQKGKSKEGVVTLSTVHKVKGLEKACVAVIGMAQGILPHWKALGNVVEDFPIDIKTKIEDERCICFVAITRAKEELLITYPKIYRGARVERSMFLDEMEIKLEENDMDYTNSVCEDEPIL